MGILYIDEKFLNVKLVSKMYHPFIFNSFFKLKIKLICLKKELKSLQNSPKINKIILNFFGISNFFPWENWNILIIIIAIFSNWNNKTYKLIMKGNLIYNSTNIYLNKCMSTNDNIFFQEETWALHIGHF